MHRTRITRINGTLSIDIPEELLVAMKLHEGDEAGIDSTERGIVVIPANTQGKLPEGIDPDFAKRVDAFIDKYRAALTSLADC